MGMEQVYLFLIIILFMLAIADLIVGVSNDAVNFLISAVGSKAGALWVILAVASAGVLVGAAFSNGMMEVARKGIFNPEMFVFSEIILIFVAVMLTDVILLDFFNTFGFPTSTTVSLVFELLGAAVAISLIKIGQGDGGVLSEYINSSRALLIIGGILLSIVVAFTIGAIVQYIARIIFTFQYEKNYKYFGSIWGGLSFAVIIFFMFIKGFKHSTIVDEPWVQWILHHTGLVLLITFVVSTIIFEILKSVFKVNILKIVVLSGTFALAMAWAGNDLVNFIGVPLAGYSSYEFWIHSGVAPDQYSMAALSQKVQVPSYFLIGAGVIMTITLWLSKKARSVIETSVNLSRQDSGYERFGSSPISRSLVRMFIYFVNFFDKITPGNIKNWVSKRFEKPKRKPRPEDPAFDLIRASVNLVVASALIAFATSYKLPLSTTYVTFMVAMGTSLADRAWGRESAVYRVTGVISVIGGWFITALIAFTVAAIIGAIIYFGGGIAIGFLVAFDVFLIYRSRIIHRRRIAKEEEAKRMAMTQAELTPENVFDKCRDAILVEIKKVKEILDLTYEGFKTSDRKKLKKAVQLAESVKDNSKDMKKDIYKIIQLMKDVYLNAAQYHVQEVDHLREIANAVTYLTRRMYEHIDNNHDIFNKEQFADFDKIKDTVYEYINDVIDIIENGKYSKVEQMRARKNEILMFLEEMKTVELLRIQKEEVDTINSNLFLNIIVEYRNLVLFFNRLLKAHSRFYKFKSYKNGKIITA